MSDMKESVDRIAVKLRKKLQKKFSENDHQMDSSQATNYSPFENQQRYHNNINLPTDNYVDDTQEASSSSSSSSNEVVQKKRKRTADDNNSNILKKIKVSDTVIQETPTSSMASAAKTFYCSQNLYESVGLDNPNVSIVQSKVAMSYSQTKISSCSTTPTTTADADKTLSGLDCSERKLTSVLQNEGYVMSQLYDSQNAPIQTTPPAAVDTDNRILTQLYDSSSFQLQMQTSSSSLPSPNTIPPTYYNTTPDNAVRDDYLEGSMSMFSSMRNYPPTSADGLDKQSPADFNRSPASDNNDPFPLTPVDMTDQLTLPPNLLLSNFCSEYDKAYTMKDLKPNQYRNYRHHESLRSLKEHMDTKIPPNKSIRDHYKMTNYPDN